MYHGKQKKSDALRQKSLPHNESRDITANEDSKILEESKEEVIDSKAAAAAAKASAVANANLSEELAHDYFDNIDNIDVNIEETFSAN